MKTRIAGPGQKLLKRSLFSALGLSTLLYVYWSLTDLVIMETDVRLQGCSGSGPARKLDNGTHLNLVACFFNR